MNSCEVWQPAHNALNDIKPEKRYQKLHRLAITTSMAYGETLAAFVEQQSMSFTDAMMSKAYFKKGRDGHQWDQLTGTNGSKLYKELEVLAADEPSKFAFLLTDNSIYVPVMSSSPIPELNRHLYTVAPFS